MLILPPPTQTYHCICTSLLLATTHTLSTLPRRAAPSLDNAYILPVPSQPPSFSSSRSPSPNQEAREEQNEEEDTAMNETSQEIKDMPEKGYSLLLGMQKDTKVTIVRREDGFEKRLLWRCMRCRLVIGYEITGPETAGSGEQGEGKDGFEGKVVYLLPNGILGTDAMVKGGKIGEGDVDLGHGVGVGVWE